MKLYLFLFLTPFFKPEILDTSSVSDTTSINQLIDHALQFEADKADSMWLIAKQVDVQSRQLVYRRGEANGYRLRGIYHELKEDYNQATEWHLKHLAFADRHQLIVNQVNARSDLAAVYLATKQFDQAKKLIKEAIERAQRYRMEPKRISTFFLNLGVAYRRQNQYDSALVNYLKALEIKRKVGDSVGVANTNINIGSLLIHQHKHTEAMRYINQNISFHRRNDLRADLWFDYINGASALIELKQFAFAQSYLDSALTIAFELKSKRKEADTYDGFAQMAKKKGDYKGAYDNLMKFYSKDAEVINETTNGTIAELQEKYEANKREQQNKLLTAEVIQQKLQTRNAGMIVVAALSIVVILAGAWWKNRQKNRQLLLQNNLIQRQNERLADLNAEKNSLISIVSHDLKGPFSHIQLWTKILKNKVTKPTDEVEEAIETIELSTQNGLSLIRNVLEVEKAETNRHTIQLEEFDLTPFLRDIVKDFQPAALGKQISLTFDSPPCLSILTDKQLLRRVVENLISNALKYTPISRKVNLSLHEAPDELRIEVADEGVGIAPEELNQLFSKYAHISSKTTGGEDSTGLGLSIVKRLVDELGGSVIALSELGRGSLFTVRLKK